MRTGAGYVGRAGAWAVAPGLLITAASITGSLSLDAGEIPTAVAMAACWLVGVVLTWRVPRHPAAWAFLALGTSMAWSAFTALMGIHGVTQDKGYGPYLAMLSDSSWLWWFVTMALALQTSAASSGKALRRWAGTTLTLGAVTQLVSLFRTMPLEDRFAPMTSPLAADSLGHLVNPLSVVLANVVGLLVLVSLVRLVVLWRRAEGEARQRQMWLVAGVMPMFPCVIGAFAASALGVNWIAGLLLSFCIISAAFGAALAVLRYRLYDVERVLSESAAYAVASAAVLGVYVIALLVVSRMTPISATVATVAATLAGVLVARQSFIWARRAVGRTLNRQLFDAVEAVRQGLRTSVSDLDSLLGEALGDSSARVLYPAESNRWATASGTIVQPGAGTIPVRSALVEYDTDLVSRDVAEAVAIAAASEIDNVALRAELARQVALVVESRARLTHAHLAERQRIERDLHDGAQQRVLAIAVSLRSARLNGDPKRIEEELDRAIEHLGMTVRELRELAVGIQPLTLSTGGLRAAVADLAERIPIPISWDIPESRYGEQTEATAWFVIAESVTNVVKHAEATRLAISVTELPGRIEISVVDDGRGGANPDGTGLRNLADRVEASGGALHVIPRENRGTRIEAHLPCVS